MYLERSRIFILNWCMKIKKKNKKKKSMIKRMKIKYCRLDQLNSACPGSSGSSWILLSMLAESRRKTYLVVVREIGV